MAIAMRLQAYLLAYATQTANRSTPGLSCVASSLRFRHRRQRSPYLSGAEALDWSDRARGLILREEVAVITDGETFPTWLHSELVRASSEGDHLIRQ
jgi:hypothetical protein